MNIPLSLRACARPMEDRAVTADVSNSRSLHPSGFAHRTTSAFRLRNLEHKARRRRMRNQRVFCISDARFGRGDAAAAALSTRPSVRTTPLVSLMPRTNEILNSSVV